MRPYNFSNRVARYYGSHNPGLFSTHPVVYNQRQILPLLDGPVQGGDGSSLPSEAAMKQSRNSKSPSAIDAVESAQPSTAIETRAQRLDRIRREIEAGTYETPEKLELAIERMLGVLRD